MHEVPSRQRWLATLVQAPAQELKAHATAWARPDAMELRAPETGLVMLRARIGGSGDRFNLGEATLTRCVLRCPGAAGATVGVGYVLGRDMDQARAVALFDALLQQPDLHDTLAAQVLAPLARAIDRRRAEAAARTATSRVHFAALQSEVTA